MFKIAIPWALKAALNSLGLGKWLRDKALHVPDTAVQNAVNDANIRLHAQSSSEPSLSVAQWRAVEATQAAILNEGIQVRLK